MIQMITRTPRIFDANILSTLRDSTTFFASACLIAIGGAVAMIGNAERISGVAEEFTIDMPVVIWEIKTLLIVLLITNALLKFIWSTRLFGYCAVVMASTPNEPDHPESLWRARQAADLNITAARAFNRGLRSIYFGLGALTWFLGPEALILGTLFTLWVLWRREFASGSRKALLDRPAPIPDDSRKL
ncbi:hypothetical protein AQS8620_02298 [Aquimixticola soesokkakensis]|uniref:DUF599 domain-containing protein n=2 Tax=Aquimixticola soesokkakensis TaxID=1519096 RepID=A0A1Y5T2N9_9RHOB|nr:hypothetical protein AQS8620_02298 [Aquimixticola soesokkakensis]